MNKLDEICAAKLKYVKQQKEKISLSDLETIAKNEVAPPRGFAKALRAKEKSKEFALIAEIKKASPSRGLIRAEFDPQILAEQYRKGGATCLSVLTDMPYFQGSDADLKSAREAGNLPVLRKDFMLDPYQIAESRSLGADAILLIMAVLSDAQAQELEAAAREYGMDVLAEVHDKAECERVLRNLKSEMLGVNNRNLKTLEVDLAIARNLAQLIPSSHLKVCESGIKTHDDLLNLSKYGYNSFLVGETLMEKEDVAKATKELLGLN